MISSSGLEAAGDSSKSQRAPASSPIDSQLLLENVITDLHWTAMQIGVVTCLLAACAHPSATWTLRSRRHLLQDDAVIMLLSLRYFEEIGLTEDVKTKIEETYAQLSAARQKFDPGVFIAKNYTRAQRQALAEHVSEWRQVAKTASAALAQSEALIRNKLSELYVSNSKVLRSFLSEVLEGNTRRVNEFGEMVLPKLTQRRRTPRQAMWQECSIEVRGRVVPAHIKDVSRGGLGITCKFELSQDERVVVALMDGRRLQARVVRQDGTQAGLAFARNLDMCDPLFNFSTVNGSETASRPSGSAQH